MFTNALVLRDDLRSALGQGPRRAGRRVVDAAQKALGADESVRAALLGDTFSAEVLALLTDERLVIAGGVTASYRLAELAGVVTYEAGDDTVFLPLLPDAVASPFIVGKNAS